VISLIVVLIPWLAAIACGAMAMRAAARRSPSAQGWNLATALAYTVIVPLSAVGHDWVGTGLAGLLALLRWVLWRWLGREARGTA
jgi:hypothetical protein